MIKVIKVYTTVRLNESLSLPRPAGGRYAENGQIFFIDLQYLIPACGRQALRGIFSVGDLVL